MSDKPMMQCGHAANATDGEGKPCCAICVGLDPGATIIAEKPSLEGREAQCPYCKKTVLSSWNLAFFEYKGPGSRAAEDACAKCAYYKSAHEKKLPGTPRMNHYFVPHGPFEYDSYYCGCRGWN